MKLIKEHSTFCFLLVLSIVLRFIPLFQYQFTYDELSGLERTQFENFAELIEKGVKIDAHPALVQVLIFYLVKFFGYQTWIIKLPFLIFGFAAILYGYALGYRHFSKPVGLYLAAFLSFSQVFVFYAPIARMYMTGVFFSLALLFYFFELVFKNNNSRLNYFLFGFFALLSGLNHHMNALFALTVYLGGFLILHRPNYKAYLLTGFLVLLAYLPHLSISLYQLGIGGIGIEQGGWLDKPEWSACIGFIKVLLGTGKIYLIVLGLIIFSFYMNKTSQLSRQQWFLLLVFVLNYLIIYSYSIFRFAIYQHSVMLFSGVAFLVFAASLINFKNNSLAHATLLVLSIALIYRSYITKNYFNEAVKTVFEYQFERSVYYQNLYGEKNIYPVFFDADDIMKRIYFEKYQTKFECKVSEDSVTQSMGAFSKFVSGLNCNYLVLSSALPAQQAVARNYFPYLVENTQTQGINYCVFSKLKASQNPNAKETQVLLTSEPLKPGWLKYSKTFDTLRKLTIDSLNEFPFDAKGYYFAFAWAEGNVIQLSARLKFDSLPPKQMQACINTSAREPVINYGYSAATAGDFVVKPDSTIQIYTDYFVGTNHKRIKSGSEIGAYLWNRGKEKATLLNFEVRLIDYWHSKWHYWD